MPIYEFRCLKCNDLSEFLFASSNDQNEIRCRHCGSEMLERVLSASNFAVASSARPAEPSVSSRQCSTGTCSTIELPGLDD